MAALMNEDLPEKSGFTNMNLKRQRTLCTGIYKTLNKLNPGYMNNFFELRNADKLVKSKLNLEILKSNKTTFGG